MDSKEYRKLRKVWDAKLKKSGFDDIEMTPSGNREVDSSYTKRQPAHIVRQHARGIIYRNSEWYRLAHQWMNERSWPREPRWNIKAWELMSEGYSQTAALKEINRAKGRNVSPKAFKAWFEQENLAMTDALCNSRHERTASYGEMVYLRGVLEETVGDYRWEVRLEDGQSVEVNEDYLRYVK